MVIWIIGLSGSGKTTLADQIFKKMSPKVKNLVKIDGDVIRDIFGNDLGHTKTDRQKNAKRISGLCKFLEDSKLNVICSILSAFESDRIWNRQNLENYYEVFIDVDKDVLIQRDSKGIYRSFLKGKMENVVGFDIDFERPKNPDMIIENNNSLDEFLKFSKKINEIILDKSV